MLDAISILVKLELIKKHSQYLVIYIYNSNGVTEGVIWHDCTALEKKFAPFIGIYIKNCLASFLAEFFIWDKWRRQSSLFWSEAFKLSFSGSLLSVLPYWN